MIPASEATPGTEYITLHGQGRYTYRIHEDSAETIIARLELLGSSIKGRDTYVLAKLRMGWLPFTTVGLSTNRTVAMQTDAELRLAHPPKVERVGPDNFEMRTVDSLGIVRVNGEIFLPESYQSRLIGPLHRAGEYTAMVIDEYHASGALSSSGLKKVARSVDHYVHGRKHPTKKKVFDFGHAVHAWGLEGEDAYNALCVTTPDDVNPRTKVGREWKAEQEAAGLVVLSPSDARRVAAAVEAVEMHPTASNILATGTPEVSYFWAEDVNGVAVPCRARPDWQCHGLLVDLKTTRDASPKAFNKSVANFGYAASLAFYMRGVEMVTGTRPTECIIIAVESDAPHGVGVYQLSDEWLDIGWRKCEAWLEVVADWLSADDPWTGYGRSIQLLEPPSWA